MDLIKTILAVLVILFCGVILTFLIIANIINTEIERKDRLNKK